MHTWALIYKGTINGNGWWYERKIIIMKTLYFIFSRVYLSTLSLSLSYARYLIILLNKRCISHLVMAWCLMHLRLLSSVDSVCACMYSVCFTDSTNFIKYFIRYMKRSFCYFWFVFACVLSMRTRSLYSFSEYLFRMDFWLKKKNYER